MQSPLEALYEYYKTFSTLDLNSIVLHFSEPCMSISSQGVFSADNRAGLAKAFGPLVDGLKAKSYGRSEFVEAQVTTLGETAALVRGVAVRYITSSTSQNWNAFRSATLCIAAPMAGKSQRWCFRTDPARQFKRRFLFTPLLTLRLSISLMAHVLAIVLNHLPSSPRAVRLQGVP
jgi:hypothetical protein